MSSSLTSRSQDHAINCLDVRNGTFVYFNPNSGVQETFTRKGALQKELIGKPKELIIWEVEWLTDCVYTLKYQSGAENHPAAEQKFLGKHLVVTEILQVTEDYMTFRTSFDKVTNATNLTDTLWIKQRQAKAGKMIINPNADSILAKKIRTNDSLDATYATLYVFRPGKSLNCLKNYNLMVNGNPACVISNGCRQILKLRKPGVYRFSAKVDGPEQAVTIDAVPGESYYLQCMITWGITSHPVLTVLNKTVGNEAFKTAEKEGLWHRD